MPDSSNPHANLSRRGFLAAGAVSVVGVTAAGCAPAAPSAAPTGAGTSAASAAGVTVPKASVPVGGGVISGSYVVTQPTAGVFKAFGTACPHKGCPVSEVNASDGIVCKCHGSRFTLADGSVTTGPATQGLNPATATLTGDNVVVTA